MGLLGAAKRRMLSSAEWDSPLPLGTSSLAAPFAGAAEGMLVVEMRRERF
jgi:hypothetical protein